MDEEMLAGFKRDPPEPMLFGEEYMCEGLANDPEVEDFAELASRECMRGTCVVATLLPWSLPAPNGVLAPEFDSSDVLLSEEEIAQAVAKVNTVLIPCTLELEEEHEQAKRIVPQLTRLEGVCIIAVLLLPKLMQLNREKFVFDGVVKITCDVKVATDSISVHAHELVISHVSFTSDSGAVSKADSITLQLKKKIAVLGFEEVLPTGKGVLEIKFRGTLNDQQLAWMAGFYRSQYTDANGAKKFLATTQFEAIDARRCFPCWDEPARKATFTVTLVYAGKLQAISNMPPKSLEILPDGRKKEVFMPTPKMSTYLLAFCVGEFEFISASTKSGVLARIFACPGNSKRCSLALKCCIRALEFYDEFFGLSYPLPKMDMIAIPDFSAGAMENWGLVTYREVALLCDEDTVSATQKQRICSVITHELAHQWFGNLVTMEWWEDLWLNEGFANWTQTFAADHLYPEWISLSILWIVLAFSSFVVSYVGMEQQRALQLDALRSSHPIQVPIAHAEEVEEVFDAISYCKGGSVVRMIFSVLGEKDFQKGLQLYFERHKYGNTVTTDLWNAWKEVSGKPIDKMMSSWTQQMGFPVLEVQNDPFVSGGALELKQRWFLADGSSEPGDDQKVWFCPVLVGTEKGAQPVSFLEQQSGKVDCKLDGCQMLKVNFGQHVPLRVLYPEPLFKRLVQNLKSLPAEVSDKLPELYVICDSKAKGVIRHASQAFQDFFGWADCGQQLFSPATLLQSDKLKQISHEAAEEAVQSTASGTTQMPVLLLSRLVATACKEATYAELCTEAETASDVGLLSQRLASDEALHAAAEKMWKAELAKGVKPSGSKKREADTSSIWSRSTASTISSKDRKHAKVDDRPLASHHFGALLGMSPSEDSEKCEKSEKSEKLKEESPEPPEVIEPAQLPTAEAFESASEDEFQECEAMSQSSDSPPLFDKVKDPVKHIDRPKLRNMNQAFVLAVCKRPPSISSCSSSGVDFPIALRSAGLEESAVSWPAGPAWKAQVGSNAREVFQPPASAPRCRRLWKTFCECFERQEFYKTEAGGGIALLRDLEEPLPAGEFAFVQPFHGRLGNPIDCLVYVKHVELDDCPCLLALHSHLPHDDHSLEDEFRKVSLQLDEVISRLASEFFYYAPMRRQRYCSLESRLLSDTLATCKAGISDVSFLVDLLGGFSGELNDKAEAGLAPWGHQLPRKEAAAVEAHMAKDPRVAEEAVRRCKVFMAEPNDVKSLNADIRAAVLEVAVQSDSTVFEELLKVHEVLTDGAAKIHMYGALGKATSAKQRQMALDFTLSGKVRSQDLIYIPMAMASSGKAGAEDTFAWMQKEYDRINDMIGATSMMLFQNMVRVSGTGFVTPERAEEVSSFWKSKKVYQNIQKALAQTVENILSNAKFVDRLKPSKAASASTWRAMESKL
ncbi:unnamed protein product [Effrenium voratum]|nr:unnamed protein product [Effrenium voratum]